MTKSWPTFSSRLIREMSRFSRCVVAAEVWLLLADFWAARAPGATAMPAAAATAVAAVAVRRVRLEVRSCT